MTTEEERLAVVRTIAAQMYAAGMGDCYDAIERLTRPSLDLEKVAQFMHSQMYPKMPEPTPYERGMLDRYQDRRHSWRRWGRDGHR